MSSGDGRPASWGRLPTGGGRFPSDSGGAASGSRSGANSSGKGERREGGGRRTRRDGAGQRTRAGGGSSGAVDNPEATRQIAALLESTLGWVREGSNVGEGAVHAMSALCRLGRREVQGDAIATVQAIIQNGCKAIAAPDSSSCRRSADVLLFLRAVQHMLYQEALKMEDSARQQAVEHLLALLTSTHRTTQQNTSASSATCSAFSRDDMELQLELTRTVGCLLYQAPAVSGQVLTTLVITLRPLLEFPRDMPTSSSAVVAATMLQQQQQQQQPQVQAARHTRVLLSACSAEALANANDGLGRGAEPFAIEVIPKLVMNLNAWSSLVTASLSLEGLKAEHGADVDVYMEALTGTLRALNIILGEVGASSSSATTVAQTLSELTITELRGGRLLPALAECLVGIVLWVPSRSAVVAAQAAGQLKGLSDSDASGVSGVGSPGGRRWNGPRAAGSSSAQGGMEQRSSTDGASTDDMSEREAGRQGGGVPRGGGAGGFGGSLGKIRLHALLAMQGLARLQPKVFQPFWAQLLPGDVPQSRRSGERLTLLSILVSDPSPKVRTAVAMALQALLQRSRTYMAAAEERRATVSSFRSFSQTLASRISATHTALCQAVSNETHATTAQHVIKALMALVAHAPYRRLRRGPLGQSVAAMRGILSSFEGEKRDVQLRTAAMGCLASLLENPLTFADLLGEGCGGVAAHGSGGGVSLAPLARKNLAAAGSGVRGGYGSMGPVIKNGECAGGDGSASAAQDADGGASEGGVVDMLLEDLILVAEGRDADANPVRVEALRAIAGVVRNHCPSVLAKWTRLGPFLRSLLQGGPPPLRTHSAKVAECLVGATEERDDEEEGDDGGGVGGGGGSAPSTPARANAKARVPNESESVGCGSGGAVTRAEEVAERLPGALWDSLVHELLPMMLSDDSPSVRASAMNTVAFIPSNHPKFVSLMDVVWANASPGDNKDSAVRGAALKTLGILTHVEPYCSDVQFMIKVSDALDRCSRDTFIAVRLKAFLALAYLCERAFIIPLHAKSEYLRHHAGLTLARLADMALRSINDHDKVRVYGARALGYLASAPEFVTLVQRSTSAAATRQLCARIEAELARIIASGDYSVKVRWNACHAAKLMLALTPPYIPGEMEAGALAPAAAGSVGGGVWGPKLISALRSAAASAHNFKVRIQATRALRELKTAEFFGSRETMVEVWRWAVKAVQEEVLLIDPSQYKYKHTLQREQRVCVVVLTALRWIDSDEASSVRGGGMTIAWAEARTVLGCILQELRSSSSTPSTPCAASSEVESICAAAAAAVLAMLENASSDTPGGSRKAECEASVSGGTGGSEETPTASCGDGNRGSEGQKGAQGEPGTDSRQAGESEGAGKQTCGAAQSGAREERVLGVRRSLWGGTGDAQMEEQALMRILSLIAAGARVGEEDKYGLGASAGMTKSPLNVGTVSRSQDVGKEEEQGEAGVGGAEVRADGGVGRFHGSAEVGSGEGPEKGEAAGPHMGSELLRLLQVQMDMEGSDLEGLEQLLLACR